MNERTLFMEALDLADPSEQEAYLLRACGGDRSLMERVAALLESHRSEGQFILDGTPDVDLAAASTFSVGSEGPGATVGPYRLHELIGEGGMGAVYLAEQTAPVRRRVALKLIKPGMDTRQVLARFEAERQALAMMDHPNIARVLDAGSTEGGRPYFVMELVRGIPITEYCDREQLSIPDRLDLFVLVCRAVQHAHQKGVIHRDLKPSNILVTVIDGAAVPKVIDFGVAKATGGTLADGSILTGFHQLVGTPLYMSPEQADLSGVDVDTRSDIYALGVLLYELLTGNTPFDSETLKEVAFDEMRRLIREVEPPKPSARLTTQNETLSTVSERRRTDPKKLSRSLRGELDWVVMKALEKDRRRRYESAGDFAADVLRYLTGRPVEARPPSSWYRFQKYARRNRAALLTAGVVGLALVTGTVVSIRQARRATLAERDTADALVEVRRQGELAEQQFRLARRAVDEMYTEVAEDWLKNTAGLTKVQRRFLDKALGYYRQIAEVRGSDPAIQRATAEAHHRVGQILLAMGSKAEADEHNRRAEEIRRLLVAGPRGTPLDRAGLANTLRIRAVIRGQLGHTAEGEAMNREAITILDRVVAEVPDEPEPRRALAKALDNQAFSLDKANRPEEARSALDRALGLWEALVAEGHPGTADREGLAHALNSDWYLISRRGVWKDGEAPLRRSLELLEALAAENPGRPDLKYNLAGAYVNMGVVHSSGTGPEKAEPYYQQATAIREKLTSDFPDVAGYRDGLAKHDRLLGQFYMKISRKGDAEPAYRRSITGFEALAREAPDEPGHSYEAAVSAGYLAAMLDGSQRYDDALVVRRSQIRELRAVASLAPESSVYRDALGKALVDLAYTLNELRLDQEMEASLREALEIYGTLVRDFPSNLHYPNGLATGQVNLSSLLRRQGRLEEAEALLRSAVKTRREMLEKVPRAAGPLHGLAFALHHLGTVRRLRGAPSEAVRLYEEAIGHEKAALTMMPAYEAFRLDWLGHHESLGRARGLVGDLDGVAAAADAVLSEYPDDPHAMATAARLLDRYARLASEGGDPGRVEAAEAKARGLIDRAAVSGDGDARVLSGLATLLVESPRPAIHDPTRAVTLAEKAVTLTPQAGLVWKSLALARLRAGEIAPAREAAEKSISLRSGGDGAEKLILAQVLARQGDATAARRHFDEAVAWRATHLPHDDEEYDTLKAGAAALLNPRPLEP